MLQGPHAAVLLAEAGLWAAPDPDLAAQCPGSPAAGLRVTAAQPEQILPVPDLGLAVLCADCLVAGLQVPGLQRALPLPAQQPHVCCI